MVYVHEGCYFFVFFSTGGNLRHVFKMSAFGTYAFFDSRMPLVNGCVNCAIQQTKYGNNVMMTPVLGRKNK